MASTERFFQTMAHFSKPLIACVNGHAVGVGVTLLPHCDVVYCAAGSTFWTPFSRAGLCPEFASSLLFPRIMGRSRASEMLIFGEKKQADWALDAGLVSAVVEGGSAAVLSYALSRLDAAEVQGGPLALKSFRAYKGLIGAGGVGADPATLDACIARENAMLRKRVADGDPMQMIMHMWEKKAKDKAARGAAARSKL
jgi:enoyl-CoA hydratase/carnithine racemase